MKTYKILALALMPLLPLASCSSDDGLAEDQEMATEELTDIIVTAPPFEYEKDARVVIELGGKGLDVTWSVTDTIGILPNLGAQIPFPIKEGMVDGQPNVTQFTGGGWTLKPSSTYSSYFPYIGDIYLDKRHVPMDLTGQWQKKNGDLEQLSDYIYMAAESTTPTSGKVHLELKHLCSIVWFEINVPEATKLSSLTLKSDEEIFTHESFLDMTQPTIALQAPQKYKEISFNLEGVETTAANQKANLYFMFAPGDFSNKQLTAVVRDIDGYEEEVVFNGKNMLAGKAYKYGGLSYVTYTPQPKPNWIYDDKGAAYQSGMTAVVTVPASMQKFLGADDEMAAYINGELRGVGKYIDGAFYLIVHGNIGETGKVSFKYYNAKKKYMYEALDVVDFNTDLIFGITDNPQQLPLQLIKQ